MRILVLVSADGWGGGESAALWLARALRDQGDDVLFVARGGGPLERAVLAAGVAFEPGCPGDGPDVRRFARLVGRLRAWKPAIVHAHLNRAALWGSLAGRWAGVPVVATAHGMTKAVYYRFAQRVIAVSRAVGNHLGLPRVDVIPNALMPHPPADEQAVRSLRAELAPAGPLLLIAAKLHPNKGQRVAIEALAHVPAARLALAGDGPDRAHLEQLARERGVAQRVAFLGHRTDVAALMAAADAVLVPSEHEAFSLAAAEALIAGTPVIAQRTGGVPEVVGDDGVLVDVRTAEAWARAIGATLADVPAARIRAARAAPRLLSACAPERVLAQILGVYAALM